ncbi:hypothetical protein AK812_SmicGene35370 [Symbiodinium microadriaticum]|uniref:SET domain-containing protein n=1 Tax=Symbiodinium microadriaticum TaxID=2951 RepID=A0A1Q9CLN0_SYMMI|nr:hypothetical protein AK812_SmicGene35370 [Symbiodinium microadriaticum]
MQSLTPWLPVQVWTPRASRGSSACRRLPVMAAAMVASAMVTTELARSVACASSRTPSTPRSQRALRRGGRRGSRPRRRGRRRPAPGADLGPEEVPMFATDPEARARRRKLLFNSGPATQLLIGDAIGDAFGAIIEMQDAYWIREFVTFDQWPKNPMRRSEWNTNSSPLWRIGDAQLQAAPRVAMEISSWGEAVASCEAQRSVGCCFVGAIRLEKEPVRGYSFVVEHDVPAHSVLLIEKPLPLKCDVPLCYHPRTAKAVPASLYFFPLFLIPGHLLEKLPRFMRTLRARLNRFEALYGLGTVFNHSCRPNARRLTDADENASLLPAATSRLARR